jgi:hypothetical protein
MPSALHGQRELSETFMASLLARNIDLEEDLCDQLFNHSEKRLARVLLKLAHFELFADLITIDVLDRIRVAGCAVLARCCSSSSGIAEIVELRRSEKWNRDPRRYVAGKDRARLRCRLMVMRKRSASVFQAPI